MSDASKYTVGWICALPTEFNAAKAFLEEKHEDSPPTAQHDNNSYALGKIGSHNVVIAVLPDGEYGLTSAAVVAQGMLHSFPNVRIGLMVGIGGGAPSSKHDVRLGDVVVSSRGGDKGGVFQYDFGKIGQNEDISFEHKDFLNQPPMALRTAVSALKSEYEMEGHQLSANVNRALERWPRLKKKYSRPPAESDRLYRSHVVHASNDAGCDEVCGSDPARLRSRDERDEDTDDPAIHYGLIASSNQLMKNATIRDKLAAEMGVLCFEMEAAGLMNHFPCLVIRGICDYSDSHKNKQWQGFAAMMAAAYAVDLLRRVPPHKVEAERRISDVINEIHENVSQIRLATNDMQYSLHFQKVMKWLSAPDPSTNDNKALQQRYENTGQWFLDSEQYLKWKETPNSSLWLYGIPGCGKTVLSSVIINNLRNTKSCISYLYFYFDFTDTGKQSLDKAIRSLIAQLYHKHQDAQLPLNSLYTSCENASRQPTIDSLSTVFLAMSQQIGEIWIVLDALDECQTRTGQGNDGLLNWIESISASQQVNTHLLVTSRLEHDIKSALERHINDQIPLQSSLVTEDIRAYVHARVTQPGCLERRWRERKEIQNDIEKHLLEKADGMFRWVACQIDELENCLDPLTLRETLASLPRTLDETYERILNRIPPEIERNARRILQFLVYSERPLRLDEACDAIAVVPKATPRFNTQNRMPVPEEIPRNILYQTE